MAACSSDEEPNAPPSFEVEMKELIFQGAEAKVSHCLYQGNPAICKHRFQKRYRLPQLDDTIRTRRTRGEYNALQRCEKKGIRAPKPIAFDKASGQLVMEAIQGSTVKKLLDRDYQILLAQQQSGSKSCVATAVTGEISTQYTQPSLRAAALLRAFGVVVGQLHEAGMVHGDLTTSNMLCTNTAGFAEEAVGTSVTEDEARLTANQALLPSVGDLVVIDFGLISEKNSAEEKAVDLYVLERALASTHPHVASFGMEVILGGYSSAVSNKNKESVLQRLEAVRRRGRKRSMVG